MRHPCFAALVILWGLSACWSASTQIANGPGPANAHEVVISNYKFVPKTLTVPVGATVTWVNHDMMRHTVTSRVGDESFDSGLFGFGDFFTHTFKRAGTYGYLCIPHEGMQGTIVVQ